MSRLSRGGGKRGVDPQRPGKELGYHLSRRKHIFQKVFWGWASEGSFLTVGGGMERTRLVEANLCFKLVDPDPPAPHAVPFAYLTR